MQTTQTSSAPRASVVKPIGATLKPSKAFAMLSAIDVAVIKNAIAKLPVGKGATVEPSTTAETAKPTAAVFTLIAGVVMNLPKFLHSAVSNHRAHGRFTGTDKACSLTPAGAVWFAHRDSTEWASEKASVKYADELKALRYTVQDFNGVQWPLKDGNKMPFGVGSGFLGRMAFFRILAKASSGK